MNIKKSLEVTCTLISISDIPEIEKEWLKLSTYSDTNFFLLWDWIGTWLEQVIHCHNIYLIKCNLPDKNVIALGLFVERKRLKLGVYPVTQFFLHRTGNDSYDQIWIENNNFLIAKEHQELVLNEIWFHLSTKLSFVDEFIIAIRNISNAPTHKTPKNLILRNYDLQVGYKVELTNFNCIDDYLSSLSKNSKQQINRSMNSLKQSPHFSFSVLNKNQLNTLNAHRHFHIQKWKNTATPSGFNNKIFIQFHQELINRTTQPKPTLIAQIKNNQTTLGVGYYFVDKHHIYFYLSCLDTPTDNKIKIGLTLHILMIEWLILNKPEINYYDFLAGEARYKSSLAKIKETYCQTVVYKRNLNYFFSVGANKLILTLRKIFNH